MSAYVHGAVGFSGVCASPGGTDVLSEASSQPLSSAVSQCSSAPQCLRAGLLRAGPQHSAAVWYANCTHTDKHLTTKLLCMNLPPSLTHLNFLDIL